MNNVKLQIALVAGFVRMHGDAGGIHVGCTGSVAHGASRRVGLQLRSTIRASTALRNVSSAG